MRVFRRRLWLLGCLLLSACGGSGDGGSGVSTVALRGSLGLGYSAAAALSVGGVAALVSRKVDRITAFPADHGRIDAESILGAQSATVAADGTFSLSLGMDLDWVLVLEDTTALLRTDRFVGYIDLSGGLDPLLLLPATRLSRSSLDLGAITAAGDRGVVTNPVTIADLTMTASELAELAKSDDGFKSVKNLLLNHDAGSGIWYTLRPDFRWDGSYAALENTFPNLTSTPAFYAYNAYNFQLDSNSTEVTMNQLCASGVPRVAVELFPPPGTTSSSSSPARTYGDLMPIANDLAVRFDMGAGVFEGRDDDFFVSNAYGPLSYTFGTFLDGAIPAGYWPYKVGGAARAQFDVAVAKPLDGSGRPLGFTPVVRANVDPGTRRITSLDVRWYYVDAGSYVEATDLSTLSHLVGSAEVYLDRRMTGTEYESIEFDPSLVTHVVPAGTWNYDDMDGIGIFYESAGIGFFFEHQAP